MTQILHIFRKDLRHHWPYALLAILVSIFLYLWFPLSLFPENSDKSSRLLQLLNLLQPVAWLLVVARLVQDEAIPGATQFWISRPYDWRCLLAAKSLFLILVLHTPLLLIHLGALARNGFSPWPHLGNLLMQQLAFFGTFVLIGWALAALTTNIAHFLLLFLVGAVTVGSTIELLPFRFPEGMEWMLDFLRLALSSAFMALLLLWQYSRRGSRIALVIAAVGFLMVLVLPRAVSASNALAWQKFLSPASVAPALAVQLNLSQPQISPEYLPANAKGAFVNIPLATKGFDERDLLFHQVEVLMVTPQGERIPARHLNIYKVPSEQGTNRWWHLILLDRRDLARVKSAVRIESKAVLSTYRRVTSVELAVSPEPRWIEGIGLCVAKVWPGTAGLRVRCRQAADNSDRITVEPMYPPGSGKSEPHVIQHQSGQMGPTFQYAPVSNTTTWTSIPPKIPSFRLRRLTYEYTGPFTWALDAVPIADLVVEGTKPPIANSKIN
jgi:hypothetical protein